MINSMKKTALAVAAASALGVCGLANAGYNMPVPAPMPGGNWYVGAFGGAVFTPDHTDETVLFDYDFKTGYDAGIDIGYRVGPFRFAGEYMYQRSKIEDLHNGSVSFVDLGGELNLRLSVQSLMANGYYDFNEVSDNFGVYLGAGVGMAKLRVGGSILELGVYDQGSVSESAFAYQGMIGFNFNVDSNFVIDVGYRYFGTSKPKDLFDERFHTHLVNLGMRYHVPA